MKLLTLTTLLASSLFFTADTQPHPLLDYDWLAHGRATIDFGKGGETYDVVLSFDRERGTSSLGFTSPGAVAGVRSVGTYHSAYEYDNSVLAFPEGTMRWNGARGTDAPVSIRLGSLELLREGRPRGARMRVEMKGEKAFTLSAGGRGGSVEFQRVD